MGIRHNQLRLVDRDRARRDFDLGDTVAVTPAVADLDQSLRRSDDVVRGCMCGPLSVVAHRAAVAGLLAVSLPEHDGCVAPVQESADLGRVRGFDLRHSFSLVLVCWIDTRSGYAA